MKRKLILCLLIILTVSMLCITVYADSLPGDWGECIEWQFNESTGALDFTGYGKMLDYTTTNAPWNDIKAKIKSVSFENGITTIGTYAFYGCENLEAVTLPQSVVSIRDSAFSRCTKLQSVDLSHVEAFGSSAFWQCESLKTVSIKATAFNLFSGTGIESITFDPSLTSISNMTFCNCQNLKTLTIPGTIEQIGNNAFDMCTNLENLYLNNGTVSIGEGAFFYDQKLTLVYVPQSLTAIAENAFSDFVTLYDDTAARTDQPVQLDLLDGAIMLDYATDGRYLIAQGSNLTISSVNDVIVTTSAATENAIFSVHGEFDVTLDRVTIAPTESHDYYGRFGEINVGSGGIAALYDSVLNITLVGESTVDSRNVWRMAGLCCGQQATANISGTGSLILRGGEEANGISSRGTINVYTGTVEAFAGEAFRSNGIGCPNLNIYGGTVSAYGCGGGAGIRCKPGQTVIIDGGIVTAVGGSGGAGIGGDAGECCGTVIIDNAIVTATGGWASTGGDGSDIGQSSSPNEDGGTIFIGKNATVNAKYLGGYGQFAMEEYAGAGCTSITIEDMNSVPDDVVIIEQIKMYSLPNAEGTAGSTVTFKMTAESHTALTYLWQKSTDQTNWEDISNSNSATLSTTASAGTYYRCKVTNAHGQYLYSTVAHCNIIGVGNTYIVNHYRQSEDGSYRLIDSELHYAKEGDSVTAITKELNGFRFVPEKSSVSGTVLADNSLVLSVYYDFTSDPNFRGTEYVINWIKVLDSNMVEKQNIPNAKFFVEVNATNLSSIHTDYLLIATYSKQGQMKGLTFLYFNPMIGQNYTLGTMIDNTDGTIGMIKAFVLPNYGCITPVSNAQIFGR